MLNSIPTDQNLAGQLDRLAAQRQLYSDAKRILAVQIILSVPCVIAWSVVVALWPALKVYAALWGFSIALLDVFVLNRLQRACKERAAKIQELFDCDVLKLAWRDLKAGRRPDAEAIMESSSKFKGGDPEYTTLKNWYPTSAGQLPIHLARIVCQRASCWWDAQLRRRYANLTIAVVVILSAIVLIVSLIGGLTVEKLVLAGLVPLMPAVFLGIRQHDEHKKSAARVDQLKEHSEGLWEKALSGALDETKLADASRQLQDEIYDHRRTSPLIFNWIYKRLRDAHEEQMNKGAQALVEEALNKVRPT